MKIMRYVILSSVFFLISCAAASPNRSVSGDHHMDALNNVPKQENPSNAAAILLLQYSNVEMLNDGTTIQKIVSKYKILNERGYYLAEVSIPYREGYDEVKIYYANTIRPDGSVVPVGPKEIKDYSPYSNYELNTGIKEKKFTMPAVEPDCIIEYAYELKKTKPVLPQDFYARFFVQKNLPIKENVLVIVLPKGRELNAAYFKTDIRPKVEEVDDKVKYTFRNSHQREIISEPDMPIINEKEVFP